MARFLTTREITAEIERIIRDAKEGVILISPYLRISPTLFQNLREADSRNLNLVLVYGKKPQLDPLTDSRLSSLVNLSVFYLENLHAKCYCNEKTMVITSLNLYDFSEQNNREMGILITEDEARAAFEDASREIAIMIKASAPIRLGHAMLQRAQKKQVQKD